MDKRYWKYTVLGVLWIVVNFFWPHFDTRAAEYIAWQFGCVALFAMSHLFKQVRKSENIAPALFLVFAMISVFTHGIHPVYLEGLTQVIMFTIAFYSIINTTESKDVIDIKKAIVLIALVNVFFGICQKLTIFNIFDTDQVIGFIGQKWNFGILCAVALPFALEWNIFLALFILVGVVLADKYAVYLPVFIAFFINQKTTLYPKKYTIPALIALAMAAVTYKTGFFRVDPNYHDLLHSQLHGFKGEIDIKFMPRINHWLKMLGYCFARVIDGWGLNSYANHIWSKDRPGQVEMHNEWLNMFFEAGLIGMAILFGWFNYIRKRVYAFRLDATTTALFIFIVAAFFHSVLHSPNVLFLFMVTLAIWEIEHGAWTENEQSHTTKFVGRPERSIGVDKLPERHLQEAESCCHGDRGANNYPSEDRG